MTFSRLEPDKLRDVGAVIAVVAAVLGGTACVEGRPKPPLGKATFSATATVASSDYAPLANGPGSAGRAGPAATGAMGTVTTPPPASTQGGAGGTSVAPGAAGMGAAGTTGTGAAGMGMGAAGMASAGAGGASGSGPGTMASAGTLTIDFTTVNQHGTYAPANVGAVWIQNGSGMFLRTLERWGSIRASHLTRWTMASGGWSSFFGIGANADEMDAVSRATLGSAQAHHVTWDLRDLQKQLVPDGKYQILIEVTEDNFKPGASAEVDFDKGPAPQSLKPADMLPYTGLTVTYQP
jgi:hypothetical protein